MSVGMDYQRLVRAYHQSPEGSFYLWKGMVSPCAESGTRTAIFNPGTPVGAQLAALIASRVCCLPGTPGIQNRPSERMLSLTLAAHITERFVYSNPLQTPL